MGNQHSASHSTLKPRKNVHWKTAGRPGVPGKPDIIPILSDEEPNAITLRWAAAASDGGAPLLGYQVECNRLGAPGWIRTAPPVVQRPELLLSGLDPPHRYQFRVAALNAVGRSDYSQLSDVLTVSSDRPAQDPPVFLQHLQDVVALENDKTEFHVTFTGVPAPSIAWFKDDYEIFSSRRTAITTDDSSSTLLFHQTQASDEGEIKCTATNRAGHVVSRARLLLQAAPRLRYPRQYEDGLLYEINETVFLKITIVGKPTPTVEWRHDGQTVSVDDRVEISSNSKFSMLKIHSARRSDRGEYQVHAKNNIGEDTVSFLVTVTAPPDPPRCVSVARQVDKSVTLAWDPPEDDGGCRIGNYVVEYFRSGWNVWLKATTSRKTTVTLFDLIEGSEYRFRIKAESPYGMSAPSFESAPVRIPGRAVDMEFLAVESRIITEALTKEDGEETQVSPAPRRKRQGSAPPVAAPQAPATPPSPRRARRLSPGPPAAATAPDHRGSNEFMLVLYPDPHKSTDDVDKRRSYTDLEDALSPPPISLSAPELSTRCIMPFKALRNAVSSTELLHEHAMARFYKAIAMKEEQDKSNRDSMTSKQNDIPQINENELNIKMESKEFNKNVIETKTPDIYIQSESIENKEYKYSPTQTSKTLVESENRWQSVSFDEDYTASTVSTDGDYSDEDSLNGDMERYSQESNENITYNPRDKRAQPSPIKQVLEEEEEDSVKEVFRPLPLPDPNFVPKPILKRRVPELDLKPITTTKQEKKEKLTGLKNIVKPKKEKKMTILRKITTMPSQKPFSFNKSKKKETEKVCENKITNDISSTPKLINKEEDKFIDEGRTVIEYYGNIVKEYGRHRKNTTPLYLNTDDLKNVAEKQQQSEAKAQEKKKPTKVKKPKVINTMVSESIKINNINSVPKQKLNVESNKSEAQEKKIGKLNKLQSKPTQQIVLKTTERATIVIPIDFQKLEEKAKLNVRSALDYCIDMCLLLVAFWVYFFKDERLTIPLLILIIYRQVQETLLFNIPDWVDSHTPKWLKRKAS